MSQCSCIIPIFNEEVRISNVLNIISQVKEVSEIICVDDGSTDNSADIVKKGYPEIKLVRHDTNQGKTAAIVTGLSLAKNDTLLLLDSDLINLKGDEISKAFVSFNKNKLDCLLLNTAPMSKTDELLRHLFRFLLLAAGNRFISKACLKEVLQSGVFKSYHLEIAQNKYLMEKHKKVAYFDISAQDVSKIHKIGFVKGWKDELKMWHQIITYAGFIFFIKQSLFFARKKVS